MNNTTKARYDMAKRMIAGRIPLEEIVMMTELKEEEVQKLKDEFDKLIGPELDQTDINFGPVLMDNYVTEEEQDVFNEIKARVEENTRPED